MPLMAIVLGDFTNVLGGVRLGALGIPTLTTEAEVNSQFSKNSLRFVYIGIGILVMMFFGSLSWTISGERISRRIRWYVLRTSL